jgi:hypothetical protein
MGGAMDKRLLSPGTPCLTNATSAPTTDGHPLLTLHPSGLRRNRELWLNVRLTCLSLSGVLRLYIQPFTVLQLDALRH